MMKKILGLTIFFTLFLPLTTSYAEDDTELLKAASQGDASQVRTSLDKGADINAKGTDGGTALMMASQYGHLDVVKLLLNKGADIAATTVCYSFLHYALTMTY